MTSRHALLGNLHEKRNLERRGKGVAVVDVVERDKHAPESLLYNG